MEYLFNNSRVHDDASAEDITGFVKMFESDRTIPYQPASESANDAGFS